MKRLETTNTFHDGMVMDFNPLVTPNNVLTSCLNGTILTYNGNENALLNDMGNGRVETAYLPEGYVPLGTAELGGIIYIVSYNPLNKKCLIGSFPSPERNIASEDENEKNICLLLEAEFKIDAKKGATVYYLKKALNEELTFNPGDKFIVYGDLIDTNYGCLYDEKKYNANDIESAKALTIRLSLGIMTSAGQLVTFKNLKEYYVNGDKSMPYHIMLYDGVSNEGKPDLTEYRSLVEQPYNVFDSKISGKLLLVVELVLFNLFDIELSHKFEIVDSKRSYTPNIQFNFSGSYPFIPAGVKGNFTIKLNGNIVSEDTVDYILDITSFNDFKSYSESFPKFLNKATNVKTLLSALSSQGYFDKDKRNEDYILHYEFIPCMNWGEIGYLTVRGQIDLDKLNTGYIGLNSWRYFNELSKSNLTWGLDIYEEEGYEVNDVKIKLTRLLSSNDFETITYSVNKKSSYCGVFYDLLPLELDYYRLTGKLKPNLLYLAEILVSYNPVNLDSIETQEPRIFYRWLYTSKVFNDEYSNTSDFKDLTLDFTPSLSMSRVTNVTQLSETEILGIITKNLEKLTDEEKENATSAKTSLSGILTEKNISAENQLKIGLTDSYLMFEISALQSAFNIDLEKNADNTIKVEQSQNASIKYTDREDANQEKYLKSFGEIVNSVGYNEYKLEKSSDIDRSDDLLNTPTNVVMLASDEITTDSFKNNTYSFKINYNNLLLVKAYCTKLKTDLSYLGRYLPLAYDENTFDLYNLKFNGGRWEPKIVGIFGFYEPGGSDGRTYVGRYNASDNSTIAELVEKKESISFNWTTNPNIANSEVKLGWINTAMFAVHWNGANDSKQLRWSDGSVFSEAAEEFTTSSAINRIILTLRSDKGDLYYYPICFNTLTALLGNPKNMISKFREFYNDFAMALNNLYRCDSEIILTKAAIPLYIYYMDDCTYTMSIFLVVNSTDDLNNCKIKINLDLESLELSLLLGIYREHNLINPSYTDKRIKEDLEKNIAYKIEALSNAKFAFSILDRDITSGINLRNYMLDGQEISLGYAIMDYDGINIVGSYPSAQNKNKLFVRTTIDGKLSITAATEFNPIRLEYYRPSGSKLITVSATTSNIDYTTKKKKPNMNDRFVLNDAGLLILKSPPASEMSFRRYGDDDEGTVDGYLNAYILPKYGNY